MSGVFSAIGTISGAVALGNKIFDLVQQVWQGIKDIMDKNRRAKRKEAKTERKKLNQALKEAKTNEERIEIFRRLRDLDSGL